MVYEVKVPTAQIEGLIQKFEGAEGFYDTEARKAMNEATLLTQRNVQMTMSEKAAINTGLSKNSVSVAITGRALSMVGKIFSPLRHMPALEHGLKPGQARPSPRAIERWIQQKGISSEKYTIGQLAFAIVRTIQRRGTIKRFGYKGVGMFKRGFEKSKDHVIRLFEGVNQRFIERFK